MTRVGRFAAALACTLVAATVSAAAPAAAMPVPGEIDPSFGSGGTVTGDGYATDAGATMAMGPEGGIFVLTPNVTNCGPTEFCKTVTLKLARYERDGGRDPAFGSAQLEVAQSQYDRSALAVGPDGKPVVAAMTGKGLVVARFGRDGHLDPGFGSGGIANHSFPAGRGNAPVVAVQADGKVLVGFESGQASTDEGNLVLARFLANGNLDPGFGQAGSTTVASALTRPAAIALREDGGIDLGVSQCCRGGGGTSINAGLDRFLAGGQLDPALGGNGQGLIPRPTPSSVTTIAPAPGGGVYLVVNEESRGPIVLRLQPNGALDPTFGSGGEVWLFRTLGFVGGVPKIATDGSGRLVAAGGFQGGGPSIFRLLPSGALDRTFGAGHGVVIRNPGLGVETTSLGLQSKGRIVALTESGRAGDRVFHLTRLFGGNSKVKCLGKRATIVGTAAKETIIGTNKPDVIAALGGADTVRGLAGNDLICGGKGNDSIFGGGGKDQVRP